MDYKQEMIKRLKEDCEVLIDKKIPKALENISDDKGINTYRNLTKALAENIKVIEECEKEEWKAMWSIYFTDDELNPRKMKKQVAVWMQNDKGDISGHQAFDIDYEMKENITNGIGNFSFEKNNNVDSFTLEEKYRDCLDGLCEVLNDNFETSNGYVQLKPTFREDFYKMCKELNYTPKKYSSNENREEKVLYKGTGKGKLLDDSAFYKEWENRFLREHNAGIPKTVFRVTDMTINIGKTTFLIRQAAKNRGVYISPIACNCKEFIEGKMNCKRITLDDIYVYSKDTKLYVDEGVSDEIIKYIEDNFDEYFIFKCIR